jgi:hypothetical protein
MADLFETVKKLSGGGDSDSKGGTKIIIIDANGKMRIVGDDKKASDGGIGGLLSGALQGRGRGPASLKTQSGTGPSIGQSVSGLFSRTPRNLGDGGTSAFGDRIGDAILSPTGISTGLKLGAGLIQGKLAAKQKERDDRAKAIKDRLSAEQKGRETLTKVGRANTADVLNLFTGIR